MIPPTQHRVLWRSPSSVPETLSIRKTLITCIVTVYFFMPSLFVQNINQCTLFIILPEDVWFETVSKLITLILHTHISKLYLSKKSKTEKSCLVYNLKPVYLNFFTFWQSPQLALSERSCVSHACDLLSPFTVLVCKLEMLVFQFLSQLVN